MVIRKIHCKGSYFLWLLCRHHSCYCKNMSKYHLPAFTLSHREDDEGGSLHMKNAQTVDHVDDGYNTKNFSMGELSAAAESALSDRFHLLLMLVFWRLYIIGCWRCWSGLWTLKSSESYFSCIFWMYFSTVNLVKGIVFCNSDTSMLAWNDCFNRIKPLWYFIYILVLGC